MSFSQRLIVGTLKAITSLICRVEDEELQKIPPRGPLIIYTNHVNVLEIPIIYTHLQPRRVHGMLLASRWKNPLLRWMLDNTGTIPLHRAEADVTAIRQSLDLLKDGETIIISPEGTRSHDGRLGPAHPGVVLLALHSRAPLVPVAYFGAENYTTNLKRLQRTDFHIRVGRLFHLDEQGERVTHTVRERMLDEMMYELARLLPEEYRGVYNGGINTGGHYLSFV